MTGTSCAFILIKLLNLPLHYFPFFLYMYIYTIIDSLVEYGYREASDNCGGLHLGDVSRLIARLGRCLW